MGWKMVWLSRVRSGKKSDIRQKFLGNGIFTDLNLPRCLIVLKNSIYD